MKKYIEILSIFVKAQIRAKLQYRGAVWADFAGFFLGYGTQLILIWILVSKFKTLNEWRPLEVMLLYSMSIVSYTLACIFFSAPSRDVPHKIRNGYFDQSMTKPLNPFMYEVVCAFSAYYLIHFLIAVGILSVCLVNLQIQFSFVKILMLIAFIAGAALIQGSTLLLFASVSFFLIGENPLGYSLFVSFRQLIEYPLSLYPKVIQILLTLIVPFGFISFYPAQYFISKSDFLMFSPSIQYFGPIVGLFMFFVANRIWLYGMSRYQSSGS